MRKLASIRTIIDVKPIESADKIQAYQVDGWWVVDQKNAHQIGDKVIYFEIDSFLPIKPEFEFLRKSSYKKLQDGTEGFRLKTIRLRGQISQGLILPLTFDAEEGEDVTEKLGVVKYEQPIPAQLAGKVKGNFPFFIPRTDEERIQNLKKYIANYHEEVVYITEKLDGSSFTCFYHQSKEDKEPEFGICSRNLQLTETEGNTLWQVARELDLENKLKKYCEDNNVSIALQGELVGPGIQGNPYKLSAPTIYFFTAFNISIQQRFGGIDFMDIIEELELKTVPILEYMTLPKENLINFMLDYAIGRSIINSDAEREGIVVRSLNEYNSFSFKAISNNFLLKHK